MRELISDILIVCGPSAFVHWAFQDSFLSGLWVVTGLTARWYQRHWAQPPHSENDNPAQ
jgi:hypothetical protein